MWNLIVNFFLGKLLKKMFNSELGIMFYCYLGIVYVMGYIEIFLYMYRFILSNYLKIKKVNYEK